MSDQPKPPDLLRPTPPDIGDFLREVGCTPIPPLDSPTHWNPWDGTGAVHWSILRKRCAEAINSGRAALLKKPYWKTSEFYLAAAPVFMAVPAGAIALSGLAGDLLPAPLDKWVAALCAGLTALSAAGYKFSTTVAKYLKDQEAKEHTEEGPKPQG